MRCRLATVDEMAPDAVCTIEMPFFALAIPWLSALIAAVCDVAIARPAASSAALLIRLPDERRLMAVDNSFCEADRFACACSERMLVLIFSICFLVWKVPYGLAGSGSAWRF